MARLLYRPPETLPKNSGVDMVEQSAEVPACSSLLELKSRLKAAHAEFTQIKVEVCLQSWAPLGQFAGDQAACLKDE